MRRERSQSSDRGRPYVPRWDNPTGQLPGTGIPSGSDSGLHGTSRRRDSSVPERSRLRTSESGASAGESRPSLFDGLSSGFSPFGAVRNMGASEGASGTSTGGVSSGDNAQTLTAMANAAIVSQLQERARASLVGSAVGAEVFHIGSPSDQQGSDFQSVRSRSTQQSLPTHPSTSPVSFGPIGSPSISGSAPPGGAMSSPGMMSDIGQSFCAGNPSSGGGSGGAQMPSMISGGVSGGVQMPPMSSGGDVGRVPSPPGLPLTDPPRVTGAYGIPAYDPVFGFASRGGAFDYQIPTPPPPPAANAGVKDPYVQLLESQSAMSMLMMQMAREMNQRSLQTPVPQQQQQQLPGGQDPNQAVGQQWGQQGVAKEMKMDEKWIPAMPVPGWKSWTSRGKELSGFKEWLGKFSGWLSLINDSYGPELWETIHADYPINPCRSPEQVMRSKRLFHILQQQFTGYSKIENLVRSQISATGITESNGFELLRLIRKEFSLMSRTEALSYREQCLKFRVKRNTEHLLDIIREVEAEIESFHAMLDASVIVHQLVDVRISEGDQFLLYLRNLPSKVQEFLQLHQNATTVLQLKLGVQDYYIRTRVQGDLGSVHVAQPVQKAGDLKDRTCFNCGKKGHLAENCPEPKKCSHCGKKGHVAKDCWEKYPDKKPKPKPKSQSSNPKGKGDKDKKFQSGGRGRGKGGKKAKGRGRGNKFRTVDGEEEEEQDEDYEGEDEPEGDDEEHPEPEGEDPSGSVNQINQMTMCVRGKCGKPAPKTASSSSTERVVSESHRVDEINLSEKFQSIGVGDPKRRWLVDSGATCHIISERWLSHYKVVYRYEVGIPVLKGAGDNVLPTRGMVDLECKVGKIKVIMRKVVICALDLNVLSSYSLHEQGMGDSSWNFEGQWIVSQEGQISFEDFRSCLVVRSTCLKNQGKSSRNQKGNGPRDMEVDVVQSSLSSEACQSKDVSTEVDRQGGRGLPKETPVQTSELSKEISCIPHVSSAENVGHFKNMRRECQVKNFDGLGPFSYVCRMIHFSEPNTNQSQIETGVEGVEQEEDFSSAYCESSVGDQHYVCVVNPERVRGFPVEINLEEGENDADENVFDDDLDSGAVPTTPPKSDQGSDREPGSKRP